MKFVHNLNMSYPGNISIQGFPLASFFLLCIDFQLNRERLDTITFWHKSPKKGKGKFFSRTKLFALFVLMVPPDPPGKGWVSPHPSRPQRPCQEPAGPLPHTTMADYSLHCVLKTRACDGKGAFLSSRSGH